MKTLKIRPEKNEFFGLTSRTSDLCAFLILKSWLLFAVFLATTNAQEAIEPTLCSNYVYYYRTSQESNLVACKNVPIENFCIPAEANDVENLELNLEECSVLTTKWIPTGLFRKNNRIRKLVVYAPPLADGYIETLKGDTFKNLQELEEIILEGFNWIKTIDIDVFRPLVSLRKISLIGFGGQFLKYRQLGDALSGLSNSSLKEITMIEIHTIANKEKVLDLHDLFHISGVNITSLVFTYNDFNAVTGTLSSVLPSLRYLECSMYWLTFAAMSFGIDSLIFLQHIEEINYAFVGSFPTQRPFYRPQRWAIDNIFEVLDSDILDYFRNLRNSPNCYFGKVFRFGPKFKRLVVRNMDFFYSQPQPDVCLEEGTQFDYIDFLQSPMGKINGTFRGLRKMKFFNLQASLKFISVSLFHEMPNLEVLLLGGNDIGTYVAADHEGDLFRFQNRSLRSLDLSGCGVTWIPPLMFSSLTALQVLNLSRNGIETLEVKLHRFGNLSLLNLSNNLIRMLPARMTDQLEALQSTDHTNRTLTIDLTGNPLSCLCNVTDFVVWMTSTRNVSFEKAEEYTCLHPNTSQVSVSRLNVTELLSDCAVLSHVSNTICPCDGLDYKRLRQVALSLTSVYCSYDGQRLSYADLVINANKTLQEYWWCSKVVENPFYRSPRFIGPVTLGFLLIVLLGIALVVIYKKRYTPADVARMMQCMDLRPYIVHFIQYLSNHPANSSKQYEFDALVYFQDEDGSWVRKVLLRKLEHLNVITPDHFLLGASMADAILDSCTKSRVVVLVLSPSFKVDDWCREVTLRAYTSHPGSVIPVIIKNTVLSDFDDDSFFASLIDTHNPIDLSVADDFIWREFVARVGSTNHG